MQELLEVPPVGDSGYLPQSTPIRNDSQLLDLVNSTSFCSTAVLAQYLILQYLIVCYIDYQAGSSPTLPELNQLVGCNNSTVNREELHCIALHNTLGATASNARKQRQYLSERKSKAACKLHSIESCTLTVRTQLP